MCASILWHINHFKANQQSAIHAAKLSKAIAAIHNTFTIYFLYSLHSLVKEAVIVYIAC